MCIDLAFFECSIGSPFLREKCWINVQLVHPKCAICIGEVSQAGGKLWLAKASAKPLLGDVHGEISWLVPQDHTGKCPLVNNGHDAAEESQG